MTTGSYVLGSEHYSNREAKFTPGPWRIGDAGNTVFGPPNGNPSPQTIASMSANNRKQNAALIAAAPELYEALRECLAYIEMKLAHTGCLNVEQIMRNLKHDVPSMSEVATYHHLGCAETTRKVNLDACRAALAKAEGRQ